VRVSPHTAQASCKQSSARLLPVSVSGPLPLSGRCQNLLFIRSLICRLRKYSWSI
jgi:hypothetical protein